MNNCNCGICDLINDCYFEGRWESCKVNNIISLNEQLKADINAQKVVANTLKSALEILIDMVQDDRPKLKLDNFKKLLNDPL